MSGALNNVLAAVLLKPTRAIGTIIPDCAIEEEHRDRLEITRNPVEQGAAINDHAFKEPAEITLRYSWSNSSPANALASGIGPLGILGFGSESYVSDIYASLLALQESRTPFTIVTGKRRYDNMLIEELVTRTDAASEYALHIIARCVQVIIVSTAAVALPPQSAQAQPQQTAATQNKGQQSPQAQPSLLYRGAQVLGIPPS